MMGLYIVCLAVVSVVSFIGGIAWAKADDQKLRGMLRDEIRDNVNRELRYMEVIRKLESDVEIERKTLQNFKRRFFDG